MNQNTTNFVVSLGRYFIVFKQETKHLFPARNQTIAGQSFVVYNNKKVYSNATETVIINAFNFQ